MRCILHQRKKRAQLFKTPALQGSNGLKSLVIKTKHLTDNYHARRANLWRIWKRPWFLLQWTAFERPINRQPKIDWYLISAVEKRRSGATSRAHAHTQVRSRSSTHTRAQSLHRAHRRSSTWPHWHCYISSTSIICALIHNGREHGRGTDTERYCVKLLSFIISSSSYHARLSLCWCIRDYNLNQARLYWGKALITLMIFFTAFRISGCIVKGCSTICIGVDKDQCFCQLVLVWFQVHWSVCGIGNCQCAHLCHFLFLCSS